MLYFHFHTAKKFGVTDFVNVGECGDKPVSQVFLSILLPYCLFSTLIILSWKAIGKS
jgi:hypothetical protein